MIKDLAVGSLYNIRVYSSYYVNGFKFQLAQRDSNTLTNNLGLCIIFLAISLLIDYYSRLDEIIKMEYPALHKTIKRVLFKCLWYDRTLRIGTRVHLNYNLVEVNANKRFNKFESSIFVVQADQVFMLNTQ